MSSTECAKITPEILKLAVARDHSVSADAVAIDDVVMSPGIYFSAEKFEDKY
jgi:hypothetical protein